MLCTQIAREDELENVTARCEGLTWCTLTFDDASWRASNARRAERRKVVPYSYRGRHALEEAIEEPTEKGQRTWCINL